MVMPGYDGVNDDGDGDKHCNDYCGRPGSECDHDGNAAAEEEALVSGGGKDGDAHAAADNYVFFLFLIAKAIPIIQYK